jgi:acyl-CoA synthetase (AMP-forming)/AMP-acid ligase II
MDLVTNIEVHARTNPEKLAIVSQQEVITYRRLLKILNGITARAAGTILQPGDLVTLMTGDNLLALLMLLALSRRGVATLPISPGYDPSDLGLTIKARLTDQTASNSKPADVIEVDRSWLTGRDHRMPAGMTPGYKTDDNVSIIAMSSGTTGVPKTIGLTYRQVLNRVWYYPGISGPMATTQIRDMITLGLATVRGVTFMLRTLWSGGTLFLPPNFMDPKTCLRLINLYCIEQILVPTQMVHGLINHQKKINGYCPSLKTLLTGGSPVTPQLIKEAYKYLCPNIVIIYGCSEAGLVAYAPARLIEDLPGATGFIVPWAKVESVGDSGDTLDVGKEGILRIHVPEEYGVRSYLGTPADTTNSFVNDWFYPGDTGYVTKNGVLVITGRVSEIINVGGNKISPTQIETVLMTHGHIKDVAVFGIKNRYGIEEMCAAIVRNGSIDAEKILEFSKKHPKTLGLSKVVFVDVIPRNAMGKILRQDLYTLISQKLI